MRWYARFAAAGVVCAVVALGGFAAPAWAGPDAPSPAASASRSAVAKSTDAKATRRAEAKATEPTRPARPAVTGSDDLTSARAKPAGRVSDPAASDGAGSRSAGAGPTGSADASAAGGQRKAVARWMAPTAEAEPRTAPHAEAAPNAPTITSIEARNGAVRVFFDPPVSPSEPNGQYTLFQKTGGSYYYTPGTGCAPATNGCIRQGLTNGTPYTFAVRVYYSGGAPSAWSDDVVATPQPGAPGPPTIASLTPGNGTLTVDWNAPADTNGSAIVSYTATISPAAGNAGCTPAEADPHTCQFTNLSPATTYTVSVTATNGVGTSTAVTQNGSPTAPPPNAPTLDSAAVTGTTVTPSWTAGAANATAVTGYEALLTRTAGPGPTTLPCAVSGTTCTATGVRGATYSVQVRATSAVGPSAYSNSLDAVVPAAAPDAPVQAAPTVDDATVTVGWTAGADNGAAIQSYAVQVTLASGTDPIARTCVAPETPTPPTGCTFTGAYGATYDIRVTATNSAGTSVYSNTRQALIPARVTAPTLVTATPYDGVLRVTWAMTDTTDVVGYTVRAVKETGPGGNGECAAVATDPAARTCRITGLDNDTTYSVTVTATAAPGSYDHATTMANQVQPAPLPVSGLEVTPESGKLAVTWAYPATAEARITGFTVGATQGATPAGTCTPALGPTARTCTITGLTNGTTYMVTLTAVAAGGPADNRVLTTTASPVAEPPTRPTGVSAVPGDTDTAVSWTASTGEGLSGYTATATPEAGSGATARQCPAVGASATSCTITGLTNGVTYTVTVVANGAGGPSVASVDVPVTPAAPAPLPPSAPSGNQISGTLASSEGVRFVAGDRDTVVTGTGYAANTPVTVGIYSTPTGLGTTTTDTAGTFKLATQIPTGFSGAHTIVAVGLAPDGTTRITALGVTVTAATTTSGGLAVTGTPTGRITLLGVALLLLGTAIRAGLADRPRRRTLPG